MARSLKEYALISLRGIAMGAADVVPGVSGGTIAFITGIYEELLETISGFNLGLVKTLREEGVKTAWQKANLNFLIALIGGIFLAVISLSHLISYLLENHTEMLWAFFFGLVLASVFFVGRQVKEWGVSKIISFIIGTGIAVFVTSLPPMAGSDSTLFLFVSGAIAICAMILPGISGSFILLILGSYTVVINAIKSFEISKIAVFLGGCVIGLLSFSRLLNWMYKKHHDITVSLLTGFLLGSLQKLWPWQNKEELLHTHSDGKEDWIMNNVMPNTFEGDPQILGVTLCFGVGFILIFALERIAKKA